MSNGFVEGQVLDLPAEMDPQDELLIREAKWWNLQPGEIGYNTPLHTYLGLTEEQWTARKLERGWR